MADRKSVIREQASEEPASNAIPAKRALNHKATRLDKPSSHQSLRWLTRSNCARAIVKSMRFSWTSLLLAPLLVPLTFSTTMAIVVGENWSQAFLTMLMLGCLVSYGATIFLFLPCLFLLSLNHRMTGFKTCLLGLMLGEVVFVSLMLIGWGSSAPDFAHPIRTFLVFFVGLVTDPITALFPLAGLTTAGLYWWLGGRWASGSVPAQ